MQDGEKPTEKKKENATEPIIRGIKTCQSIKRGLEKTIGDIRPGRKRKG
jgi:hypothetical protein